MENHTQSLGWRRTRVKGSPYWDSSRGKGVGELGFKVSQYLESNRGWDVGELRLKVPRIRNHIDSRLGWRRP